MSETVSLLKEILRTSRPSHWVPFLLIFIGSFLYSGGKATILFYIQFFLLIAYNFYVYGINDIYDIESDKNNARKNKKIIDERVVKIFPKLATVIVFFCLISSIFSQSLLNIAGMLILIIAAYIYSAPPLRLKTKPPIDSIINASFFIGMAWLGWSYAGNFFNFPVKGYFLAIIIIAAHALSTIADFKSDKNAKDKTIAVKWGKRFTAIFASTLVLVVIIFSGIVSPLVRWVLYLFLLGSLSIVIYPKDKFAKLVCYLLLIYTSISSIFFLL